MEKKFTSEEWGGLHLESMKVDPDKMARNMEKVMIEGMGTIRHLVNQGQLKTKWDCIKFLTGYAKGCNVEMMPTILIFMIDELELKE